MRRVRERKGTPDQFFRVGVKGGGCSGLEYVLMLESETSQGDFEAEFDGLKVVCDPKSATFLTGSILEFTGNLIGGGFAFNNPNAKRSCGCGTSFTPKETA